MIRPSHRALSAFAGVALFLQPGLATDPISSGALTQTLDALGASEGQRAILNRLPRVVMLAPDTPHDTVPEDARAKLMQPLPFNDFALIPQKAGEACRIFSITRAEGLLESYQGALATAFEDPSVFSAQELAQFTFFHEASHCGQNIRGRTMMDYESEADFKGIAAVLARNPASRIAETVMALRVLALWPEQNGLALHYRLKDQPLPPAREMLAAIQTVNADARHAAPRLLPAMTRRFGVMRAVFTTQVGAYAQALRDAETPMQRDAAQIKLDALRFMKPKLADAALRYFNRIPNLAVAATYVP